LCKVWTWPKFYNRIKARDAVAGRPASDPEVVLAVWLYASVEGIGSARAIDRLCQQHAAYRWLCGGVPINYDLLAAFRRENAALLDRLLTQSITGLVAEKLISPEELAIDGTKVRLRKPSRGEDQHTFARYVGAAAHSIEHNFPELLIMRLRNVDHR
jgi:transposase